jgi:DDE domain
VDLLSSLAPDVGVLAREHRHCRCMGEKWGRVGWDGGHCAGYRWDGGAGSGAGFWRQRAFQAGLASPRTGPTPSRSPSDPCLFGAHRARIRRIGHQRIGRDFTIAVSYEAIRRWCAKFGQAYANQLRRRRPRPGDTWHLDEVFVGINGRLRYLWRAVDQRGNVLDVLVQSRRNAVAAKRFFRTLLKGVRYVPRVLVTDKLGSSQVAHRELMSAWPGCRIQRCAGPSRRTMSRQYRG